MGFFRILSLLSVFLFCSCWVHETTGRAIPNRYVDISASGLRGVKRAEMSEFATMYDLYDRVNPSSKDVQTGDGSPRLRPIGVVLKTMQATPATALSPLVAQASPTIASAVTAPPAHLGSGPVLLPSSVYKSLVSSSGVNDLALGSSSNATVAPSKHLVVLGVIIGGILFFTVCVFILMSPPDSLLGCARFKRASGKEDKPSEENAMEPEKAIHDASWVAIPSPSTSVKRPSLETVKERRESERRVRDTVIEVVAALSASESKDYPTSKFSICSSEYAPSSTYTSDLASNTSTVKVLPIMSKHLSDRGKAGKPMRPPRPPTTDSARLTDSVYIACSDSDQPYVIVAPQPLTDDDFSPGTLGPQSPRKFLTSTEFVALHLRITGGHLPPGMARSSLDSRHSRTKSAPALGRRNRTSCLKPSMPPSKSLVSEKSDAVSIKKMNRTSSKGHEKASMDDDVEADSDVQESIIRRVTKHRRSRSASGWAYPSKGRRARRPFKLEEE